MPRYFMRDTPLQALEQLMMSQPGQKPRGGGIYRSPFHYTPKDVACEYCQNYVRKHPCRLCECTCLEERIEAGVPGYDRLLSAQCAPDAGFLAVVQRHAGTAWQSASLELDTERCDHGGRAARRGTLLVHPAGYCTESIQVGASANDRGFCVSGKCSRRKGRCVV